MNPERSGGFAVLVAGVPGVGKTTLLKAHVAREPRDRAIVGSSVLAEVLSPKTLGDLDSMSEPERAHFRTNAIERLREAKRSACGRVLVDGHLTLRNRRTGAFDRTFTPADAAFYDALVLVEAPPGDLIAWRARDERAREQEDSATVLTHLREERAEAQRIAGASGLPLLIIEVVSRSERLHALAALLHRHAPLEQS